MLKLFSIRLPSIRYIMLLQKLNLMTNLRHTNGKQVIK
jgi:hypothetical protein